MSAELEPGAEVGSYRIEAVVGRGGMGAVYRAHDSRLGRQVALKVLTGERAGDEAFRERFIRESRILASLDDPHIVPIFDAGEADGRLYIAMRLVLGPDLRSVLDSAGAMDPVRATEIIAQLADALDAAHARGLVHRDVKPANVLLAPGSGQGTRDHVYLSDFGLTKSATSDSSLTAIGSFMGTPGYVAPEQIEGKPLDHRVDVYALGCVLYSCLTGLRVYPRDSTIASLWAHLQEPPPRPTLARPGLPEGFDAVIDKAMSRDPAQRFQTCGGLAVAARAALGTAPSSRGADPLIGSGAAFVAGVAAPDTVIESAGFPLHASAKGPTDVPASVNPPTLIEDVHNSGQSRVPPLTPTVVAPVADLPATVVGPGATVVDQNAPTAPVPLTMDSGSGARRGSGGPSRRTLVIAGAAMAAVVAVSGLALAFGTGGGGPSPTPSPSDISASVVDPTSFPTNGSLATAGPSSALPTGGPGVPAAPSPTPTPQPTPTPTPKPTPTPTPKPDTSGPTGGTISIFGGKSLTTSLKVTVSITRNPTDPSGVTTMAVSNGSTRPSKTRAYDKSFPWTLSSGKAGTRSVYVWFRDRKGNWSAAVKDAIKFDHPPVEINAGTEWDLTDPSWCDNSYINWPIIGYNAKDADGNGTLTVTRAWYGSTKYPIVGGEVRVGVASSPFPLTHYRFDFEVKDDYGVKVQGRLHYRMGPC